ncbi:reverse transcriptase domain-containing protein [Isoptericola nanjingensis]|uniref:reverse transcriptase domain-containing protein n=1 Tax=Isoptericola nanjingensis TaxID=903413 RepID=UPI003D1AF74E
MLETRVADTLPLDKAASEVTSTPMDHLPILAIDLCLSGSEGHVIDAVRSEFAGSNAPRGETISMPRKGYGPRPVYVMPTTARTLYYALSSAVAPDLPPPSRTKERWERMTEVGMGAFDSGYIVEFDIASCYEYISHELLRRELTLQTGSPALPKAIHGLLGSISPRGHGLPQLMSPSDLLADTYLEAVERRLVREGISAERYADDFRVLSNTWESANTVIEIAAEVIRDYGLVLSTSKTSVMKCETARERDAHGNELLSSLLNDRIVVRTTRTSRYDEVFDDDEDIFGSPSDDDIFESPSAGNGEWAVLRAWENNSFKSSPEKPFVELLPTLLSSLASDHNRIGDDILQQIVFETPLWLGKVLDYVERRNANEAAANRRTLRTLCNMGRQSPWAKLVLLDQIEKSIGVQEAKEEDGEALLKWAHEQATSRYETVRTQAIWLLSSLKLTTEDHLLHALRQATPLSIPALAGAAARMPESKLTRSLRDESSLSRAAYKSARNAS